MTFCIWICYFPPTLPQLNWFSFSWVFFCASPVFSSADKQAGFSMSLGSFFLWAWHESHCIIWKSMLVLCRKWNSFVWADLFFCRLLASHTLLVSNRCRFDLGRGKTKCSRNLGFRFIFRTWASGSVDTPCGWVSWGLFEGWRRLVRESC